MASMNQIVMINATTIDTTSVGIFASSGIEIPPIRRMANTNAENRIPIGLFNPRSDTAIPSHPILGRLSEANAFWKVPNPSITPPRPAKAPEMTIARIIVFLALIPAYSAACLFKPTVFNSKIAFLS